MQMTTTSTSHHPLLARKPHKNEGVICGKTEIAELNPPHSITSRVNLLAQKYSGALLNGNRTWFQERVLIDWISLRRCPRPACLSRNGSSCRPK